MVTRYHYRNIVCAVFILCLVLTNAIAQQITPTAYGGNVPVNYIRTWDAVKPGTDPTNIKTSSTLQEFRMATQYFDGLGRPIQTVAKRGSWVTGSNPIDLVSPVVYDSFDRERIKYLPFAANSTGGNTHITDGLFKSNPFQEDSTFDKSQFSTESWYYSQTNFDNSPLNRVFESFSPGDSWVGTSGQATESNRRSIKIKDWVNTAGDSVRVWTVTNVTNNFGT